MKNKTTLIEILHDHALNRKDDLLYRYLEDESSEPLTLTFSQVDAQARAIAATLLQTCQKGDRALMLYPAGLEFITAFYGCLYAGIIAVPAYPPRKNQKLNRLKSMISDAEAAIVLTTEKSAVVGKPLFESDEILAALPWLITDGNDLLPAQEIDVKLDSEDIAFLQYTSGSTGDPKGVMVNHANIMSNMDVFYTSFGHNDKTIGVSWLPHFHDMGLIGGVMQPLYGGFEVTLMAPSYFLQKPIRWLRAVSEYGANSTGGPNFAYDLCVDNINEEDLVGLDLSTWTVAPNGAEPIHASTLKNFSEKFAKCGFEHKNHYPCYGMAETTLMVTGASFKEEPMALNVSKKKLQEGVIVDEAPSSETQSLVSSGHAWLDHEVLLVDPNSFNTVEEDNVAEVWIRGKSVTQGYWKNPEKTEETFHAFTNDTKQGPFLRTGDLGFLHKGELFICGRAKDLLIIRGRNYYPQDIEETASSSHEALMYNSCAAFSTTIDNQEQLILVQEVKRTHIRKIDPDEIFAEIKKSVSQNIEVQLHDIVLVRPGQVLKTSSGKIQRQANKKAYEAGEFSPLASVKTQEKEEVSLVQPVIFSCDIYKTLDTDKSRAYVKKSIRETVACLLEINIDKLKTDQDLLTLGLDSLTIAQFVAHLECSYSLDIEFETLFEIDSLDALIELIQEKLESGVEATPMKLISIEKNLQEQYEPFNLNDIQQAYLLGRGPDMILGNTSCFAYTEIESKQIDIGRLEKAWNQLIKRHDMLHCVINEDFTQKVLETTPDYMLNETDISDLSEKEADVYLLKRREELSTTVLDPSQWPMIFIEAFHLANGKKRIMIYIDMLICDASSIYILLNDLKVFYDTPKLALAPLEIGFRDYIKYEDEYKQSTEFNKSLDYWKARLETLPNGPELPLAVLPESIEKPKFSRRHFRLSAEKWNVVQDRAKSLRITPTVMMLSLFSRVLSFWSNSPHFCVNLTLFNRMPVHEQINSVVGDFTSLIPLEVNAKSEKSLQTLFKEIQKQLFKDIEYKEVSGVRVLRELRSLGEEHIMPVVFTSTLGLKGLDTSWLGQQVYSISQTPQVWLDNQVSEVNGDLVINWDCIDALFEEGMLDDMFEAYTGLIESLVESDELLSAQSVSLLPQKQLDQRESYNQTEVELSTLNIATVCMHKAVELNEKEAIKTSTQSLSYAQLHNASFQIADFLQENGANTKEHIAIFLNKGSEQVLAVMGTAYAGVPYLPIATDLPQSRIDFLLEEANVKIVLSDAENIAKLTLASNVKAVDINTLMELDKAMPLFDIKVDDKALAYTIFTSGSTGKPKGVMISNESVCNTIMDINARYNIDEKDRIFAISALNFDLSVFDIYGAFTTGATLVIPDEDERKDASAWLRWAVEENITVWNSVPAIVKLLCDEALYKEVNLPESLRLVLMSGDFIAPQLTQELASVTTQCEMVSLGGATEGSIWSIYYPIEHSSEEKIPYGYALANQEMHILDSALQARPNFVQGDIYIKGKGVALGYLNDAERTAEQFISTDTGVLYKTGDIGFFNAKGYIEIGGRIDDQVKIHGYRVELGEIETQLLALKGISEAVVLAKEDAHGHKVLVGYVVSDHEICLVELKEDLLDVLPEYMVPNAILILDEIPLTANAKIDKKLLLNLEVELEHSHDYVAPRDEIERKLAEVFAQVLKVEQIGLYDNFFEMGGDSLLATQLVSRLRKELDLALPLKDLFVHATIESLREYIRHHATQADQSVIEKAKTSEQSVLSFAQEGLWFIDQLKPESSNYNLPIAVSISGDLDLSKVEQTLNTIINRHASLRTIFPSKDGVVEQKILEDIDFKVQYIDVSEDESLALEKARKHALAEANTPFDLAKGPLIRAQVMKIASHKHVLVLNMHHIISDGWSIGIIFKEFDFILSALMQNEDAHLPELHIDYVDYSVWHRKILEEGRLQKDLDYWEKELMPFPKKLNVSALQNRDTKSKTKAVKTISKAIDEKTLEKFTELRNKNNWTLNQILLTVYSALIYRYTNNPSMVIAVPNANRPTSETEEIVGLFVNTMLIKIDFDFSSSYADITKQVQDKFLGAIDHQDAPLQSIIENIRAKDSSIDIDDSFQFSFNSLPMGALPKDESKPLAYEVFDIGLENATNLLVLTLDETDGKTDIQMAYDSSLLADEKVEEFLNHYHDLIEEFCEDSDNLIMLAPIFNEEIIEESVYSKDEIKGVYPFTQVQTDMYLQGQIHFDNKYIIGWSYPVDEMDEEVLRKSIGHVFSNIDTINLRYAQHNGQSYQMVLNTPATDTIVELEFNEGDDVEALIYAKAKASIDLDKDSPVKAVFAFKEGKLSHVAYMGHHAVMDGLSLVSVKSLVDKTYKQYLSDKEFAPLEINTAVADIQRLITKYNPSQEEYWREPLSKVGSLPIFNAADMGAQKIDELFLEKEMLKALNMVKKNHKVSIFALMNALYLSVLYRLFNFTEDLVLFETLSVRKSLKDMSLGMYVDIRPVIVSNEWFRQDLSIVDLAKNIHNFQQNSTVPLSMQAQSKLIQGGDVILGVNFVPQLKEKSLTALDEIPVNEVQFSIFGGSVYTLRFTYPENVFGGVDITQKFLLSAQSLIENEAVQVLEMNFLEKEEEQQLLSQFDLSKKTYGDMKTIHQHFEEQVVLRADKTALVYENESLSYKELNDKANQLAHYLIAEGVKADDLVGICVERSLEMIVGLLAILKAGGAYLPIDPSSPKERIEYILEDSRTKLVLTQARLEETLVNTKAKVVFIDTLEIEENKTSNPEVEVSINNMAYVIYTSGSTGKPKGVMLEHANVDRLFQASQEEFSFDENDSWTLFHSFAFDFSVWEIWGALLHGGKLHILSYELTRSGEGFYNYLVDEKVTILNQTPAAFHQLIHIDAASDKRLDSLRKVIFGGEKLDFNILSAWYEKYEEASPALVNMYGITETTVHVTYHTITKEDIDKGRSLIGKPYDDLSAYILDTNNNLVPKGLPGELHIAGDGLARGYLFQKELTDEKFINNPFKEGTKLYKTGDLVRFSDNGDLEYLGRTDDQVKVRGFRIELGEIEHQLLNIDVIDDAVVLVKEDQNANKYLMAYISTVDKAEAEFSSIKAELSQHLPDYMVPPSMLLLDVIPLTSNGKVDKKALVKLDVSMDSSEEYVAPRDETEETLARLFAQILNISKVGIYDNFFELGGNSLLSVQLVALIKAEGLNVEVKDIFQAQNIAQLSEIMQDDTVEEALDLDKEAFLEEDIKALETEETFTSKDVLLTGATGFVGRYLLQELLETSDVNVYCAVRASSKEDGLVRVKKSLDEFGLWKASYESRVLAVPSDLAKVKLGIAEDEYEDLSKKIDKVYHSATYMNHLATYEFLKEVNIGGLKEILRFVSHVRNKTLEYVSTIELLNDPNKDSFNEEVSLHDQVHFKANGYASTKYVAEEICLVAQKRGIHTNIYRLGLITGDTKTGKNDSSQWFGQLLEANMTLSALFHAQGFNIPITPVDFVAKSIVSLGNSSKRNQIYHITNNSSVKLGEMLEMYNDKNESLEKVSLFEFIQKLKAYNATHEPLAITTFLMKYLEMSEEELSILQETDVKQKVINTEKTLKELKSLGVEFPSIDKTLIKKYFNAASH